MADLTIMSDVTSVEFGTLGTVTIRGSGPGGVAVAVNIPLTSLGTLIPRLAKAATIAVHSPAGHFPHDGTPVQDAYLIQVATGNAFPARDTREPGLTLHTPAGTLQFHFPPAVAAEIGRDLSRIATAALAPQPSKRN
jgi:hypothetical protein